MPSQQQIEGVLNGHGRVMQVYNQSQDPGGAPSLGHGGLCMGLSYSFLRGQLKAARDAAPNGCYFNFRQATPHARFAQASAMLAQKLSSQEDKIEPMARSDGLSVRRAFQMKWPALLQAGKHYEIGKEITLQVDLEMLGELGWLYAILSIYKPSKASHAIALKAQCPEGPYLLYDPNLGLIRFDSDMHFDEGFAQLFAAYYRTYHGCLMRVLAQA